MLLQSRTVSLSLIWLSSAGLMLSYQNCGGQFSFGSKNSGQGATISAGGSPSTGSSSSSTGGASGTGAPGSTGNPTANPGESPTPGTDQDIVECDMGASNQIIELAATDPKIFLVGSSNQLVNNGDPNSNDNSGDGTETGRVCMSQNACLVLMNSYASVRSCTLHTGAATASSTATQCTAIFPGSLGTCKNATIVSDSQVAAILMTMGQ